MSVHEDPPQDNNGFPSQGKRGIWFDRATPQSLGLFGEWVAMEWLLSLGYLVERAHPSDLVVGKPGIPGADAVEVKTARVSPDGTYHFTLFKDGHTDHRHSKFLILLCITPDFWIFPYVIPTGQTMLMTHITIASDPRFYKGRWAEYLRTPGNIGL